MSFLTVVCEMYPAIGNICCSWRKASKFSCGYFQPKHNVLFKNVSILTERAGAKIAFMPRVDLTCSLSSVL